MHKYSVYNKIVYNDIYRYMSQVLKLGYERNIMAHMWWGKGDRSGMPVDVQVS